VLGTFSMTQLCRVIADNIMVLLQEVVASLSVPDLQPLEEQLASLKKAVYRAFPSFRWEASYNAISYRRVRVRLDMFKVLQYFSE